jgi:hypothetical protein
MLGSAQCYLRAAGELQQQSSLQFQRGEKLTALEMRHAVLVLAPARVVSCRIVLLASEQLQLN